MSYISSAAKCDPFLRWAGGKSWLLPMWLKAINGFEFKDYHEPFVGGGTTFFALQSVHKSYLSDLNNELITTYKAVKDYPDLVIESMKRHRNTEEDYYKIRDMKCRTVSTQAARFIYLNQTSFNGLYRVNSKGRYNVPYGFRSSWSYDYLRIKAASDFLNKNDAQLYARDFEDALQDVKKGDLAFLDPPYTVSAERGNGFVEYNDRIFSLRDQARLCESILELCRRGAFYFMTNAAHPVLEDVFAPLGSPLVVRRQSSIGGRCAKRGVVEEFVYSNLPGIMRNE